ncbi:MAG: hypothetical protein IJW96_04810 [Clostridia bacterium]|nr:hypothetical protein [Clostridia bacterium]
MEKNQKKGAEIVKSAMSNVGKVGKNIVDATKDGISSLMENLKKQNLENQKKKYCPLFPNDYLDADFNIPNLVHIVDDAVRKGIEVCDGAIGWLSKEKGVEILHLYDEEIAFSSLQFLPAAVCDSVYYVDPFNRNCYISLDSYFSYIQQAKLAELQHIAFSLGAKHYIVELIEMVNQAENANGEAKVTRKQMLKTEGEYAEKKNLVSKSQSVAEMSFTSTRKPTRPKLCWFAQDHNVRELVNMRCSKNAGDMLSNYVIELSNSNTATISVSTAIKVEGASKSLGANSNFSKQSVKEHNSKLIFKLKF